jgi:plastocyanin
MTRDDSRILLASSVSRRHFVTRSAVTVGAAALAVGAVGSQFVDAATQTTATSDASPPASPSASPAASPAAGGTAFTVNIVDLDFDPKAFTIPANTDVKVTATNQGVIQHNFTIDALKIATKLLEGGTSETVTINAAAGTYEYYCSVPGHKLAGMIGTLTVK